MNKRNFRPLPISAVCLAMALVLACLGTTPASPLGATSRAPTAALPSPTVGPVVPSSTPGAGQIQPAADQAALQAEWRFAYTGGILLVETCLTVYATQDNFQQGQIELAEAQAELAVEANFLDLALQQLLAEVPSENAAAYIWQLDEQMRTLVDLWGRMNSGQVGAPEITTDLDEACSALQQTVDALVTHAVQAGLSESSLREIEVQAELDDMLEQLQLAVSDD